MAKAVLFNNRQMFRKALPGNSRMIRSQPALLKSKDGAVCSKSQRKATISDHLRSHAHANGAGLSGIVDRGYIRMGVYIYEPGGDTSVRGVNYLSRFPVPEIPNGNDTIIVYSHIPAHNLRARAVQNAATTYKDVNTIHSRKFS